MRRFVPLIFLMVVMTTLAFAQEKSKSEGEATVAPVKVTPLRVSVTFVEFEGEKKVKSLPYSLVVVADGKPPSAKLRMGSRVPVYTGKENGMQYLDVGSNIDCQAFRADNAFDLKLSLDRSWVEGDVAVPVERNSAQSVAGQFPEPVIRQFRSDLSLVLRDGQTVESTFATDPLSGKVFKVEVSLNLLK
ncbi:MAG TPA: hypothetical protein VFA40_12445 [Terriglobales bacterium]|nr:hypothetical protein [Terriglobales bacterium]